MLFLENVKGLLSADEGRTFLTIIQSLDELGYDLQWSVLNSKDYGVPQNRERVFIIGHSRGQPRPKVFPLGEDNQGIDERADNPPDIRCLQGGGHSGGHHSGMTLLYDIYNQGLRSNQQLAGTLKGEGVSDTSLGTVLIHTAYPDLREYKDTSPAISTPSGGGHLPFVAQALQTDGQLRDGVSWGTDKPQSARNIRRLTPIECERLQGFPDNWTKGISDSQRYKCLGNAVTVNVIEAIGRRLKS